MPRTFKALKKSFIDDQTKQEGETFTTSFFDKKDSKVPKHLKEVGENFVEPEPEKEDSLESQTVPQLKAIAEELGIEGNKSMNKVNLITAIESIRMVNDTTNPAGAGLVQKVAKASDVNPA